MHDAGRDIVQATPSQILRPVGEIIANLPGNGVLAQSFCQDEAEGMILIATGQRELGHGRQLQQCRAVGQVGRVGKITGLAGQGQPMVALFPAMGLGRGHRQVLVGVPEALMPRQQPLQQPDGCHVQGRGQG